MKDNSNTPNSVSADSTRRKFLTYMKLIAWAEGTSFLVLLFIAMPMKYIGGNHSIVRVVGSMHGGLFLVYVAIAIMTAVLLKWRFARLAQALVASVLPFGPFLFEAHLRRQLAVETG